MIKIKINKKFFQTFCFLLQICNENRSSAFNPNWNIDDVFQKTVCQGSAILERTFHSLYRTTRVVLESEEIGTGVIQELSQQREVLVRTRDRLADTGIFLVFYFTSCKVSKFKRRF